MSNNPKSPTRRPSTAHEARVEAILRAGEFAEQDWTYNPEIGEEVHSEAILMPRLSRVLVREFYLTEAIALTDLAEALPAIAADCTSAEALLHRLQTELRTRADNAKAIAGHIEIDA
jgi:hypothetical protein